MDKKNILLIEDDTIDIMAIKRSFKDLGIPNELNVVNNGQEAIEYLQNPGNPKPALIIMDINMPKMNGIEFLKIVRNDYELKFLPIIVLTTSQQEKDRESSFNLGVAGYMIKPVDYGQFLEMMKVVTSYWKFSELPPGCSD